ncbi:hypothetical protein V5O48_018635, partial [Marasmius crinis-equi]
MPDNPNKRPRNDNGKAPAASTSNANGSTDLTDNPTAWDVELRKLPTPIAIPPEQALIEFRTIYKSTIDSFSTALGSLQDASARGDKFRRSCDNGTVPPRITRSVHIPIFQFNADALLVKDTRLAKEIKAAEDAIAAARAAAIAYVDAGYHLHEEMLAESVKAETVVAKFKADLEAYLANMSVLSGVSDTAQWHPFVTVISRALLSDLESARWNHASIHKKSTEA